MTFQRGALLPRDPATSASNSSTYSQVVVRSTSCIRVCMCAVDKRDDDDDNDDVEREKSA